MAESSESERARLFMQLHRPGQPLLLPNPWDVGSARILASLGYEALATTSSGAAATLGLRDGALGAERALTHAAAIATATELPVSADLENGFADDPEGVARTARGAVAGGLAGFSIEDHTGDERDPIYPIEHAAERVRAAAEAALYAPGLVESDQIRTVVESVDRPVNVLARPGMAPVSELAKLGVARISVGGAFAFAAIDALVVAARELREQGTYGFATRAGSGVSAAAAAFPSVAPAA